MAELARRKANGKCQLCNDKAPFLNTDNIPFLEVHYIKWLSKAGKDTIENTVALCPRWFTEALIMEKRDMKTLQ